MTTFLDRAVPLLERGFSIIPLQAREKKPVTGMGVTRKSRNPQVIQQWAEKYPDANVAVCADETFLILDADDAAAMLAITGPLNTYTVQSSPGKAHFYFRRDPQGFNYVRNLELGKVGSLRADNQYVVGEGSIHPKTGEPYKVINAAPVAIIDPGVYHRLEQAAAEAEREIKHIRDNWDGKTKIASGMRQYFLTGQAGRLHDGTRTEEQICVELLALNATFCDPPKSVAEVERIAGWIMTKEPNRAAPEVELVFGTPTIRKGDVLNPIGKGDRWFPLGQVGIVFGFSNAGKSTFTLQMLEAVANRVPFLGHTSEPRSILVVPLDRDTEEYYETLDNMDIATDRFLVDRPERRVLADAVLNPRIAVPLISKLIDQHGRPEVVFLEGLDIFATDQTQKNIVPLMLDLQDVARHYGTAIIGSWGCPKKQATRDGYQELRAAASGSGMLGRMATTMIMVVKDRNVKGVRHITVDHKRAEEETFIMKYVGSRLKVVAATDVPEEPKDLIELAIREGWDFKKYTTMAGQGAVSRSTWARRKRETEPVVGVSDDTSNVCQNIGHDTCHDTAIS